MTPSATRLLAVVHYHWRPGGVRRVIETALPALARTGRFHRVTLAGGEAPEAVWLASLRAAMGSVPLDVEVFPSFAYRTTSSHSLPREEVWNDCRGWLAREGGDVVIWAHNLALGRNAALAAALGTAAKESGALFLSHHHDFLFDNRWGHWASLRADGLGDLAAVAEAFFPSGPRIAHLCPSSADHSLLARGFGTRAVHLPNPVVVPRVRTGEKEAAREFLSERCGPDTACWLMPCRLMRRKNIAEAVLLARWHAPGTAVVTTGGPSSAEEQSYATHLVDVAKRDRWPLRLSVLQGDAAAPSVAALMACADAVVSTSLREGFGLTAYEAAAAERPVLARATADLDVSAPQGATVYEDILVPDDLFDRRAELERQEGLWRAWRQMLPAEAQAFAVRPDFLERASGYVAFSRLTLRAQIEVLAHPAADLRAALDSLNPRLASWCGRGLPETRLAGEEFTAQAFAERFCAAIDRAKREDQPDGDAAKRVLEGFLDERLAGKNFYPLLSTTEI